MAYVHKFCGTNLRAVYDVCVSLRANLISKPFTSHAKL